LSSTKILRKADAHAIRKTRKPSAILIGIFKTIATIVGIDRKATRTWKHIVSNIPSMRRDLIVLKQKVLRREWPLRASGENALDQHYLTDTQRIRTIALPALGLATWLKILSRIRRVRLLKKSVTSIWRRLLRGKEFPRALLVEIQSLETRKDAVADDRQKPIRSRLQKNGKKSVTSRRRRISKISPQKKSSDVAAQREIDEVKAALETERESFRKFRAEHASQTRGLIECSVRMENETKCLHRTLSEARQRESDATKRELEMCALAYARREEVSALNVERLDLIARNRSLLAETALEKTQLLKARESVSHLESIDVSNYLRDQLQLARDEESRLLASMSEKDHTIVKLDREISLIRHSSMELRSELTIARERSTPTRTQVRDVELRVEAKERTIRRLESEKRNFAENLGEAEKQLADARKELSIARAATPIKYLKSLSEAPVNCPRSATKLCRQESTGASRARLTFG